MLLMNKTNSGEMAQLAALPNVTKEAHIMCKCGNEGCQLTCFSLQKEAVQKVVGGFKGIMELVVSIARFCDQLMPHNFFEEAVQALSAQDDHCACMGKMVFDRYSTSDEGKNDKNVASKQYPKKCLGAVAHIILRQKRDYKVVSDEIDLLRECKRELDKLKEPGGELETLRQAKVAAETHAKILEEVKKQEGILNELQKKIQEKQAEKTNIDRVNRDLYQKRDELKNTLQDMRQEKRDLEKIKNDVGEMRRLQKVDNAYKTLTSEGGELLMIKQTAHRLKGENQKLVNDKKICE